MAGIFGRLLCRIGRHDWDSEYEFPAYIEPQGFFTSGGGFPLATVVNESKGYLGLKCRRCGEWDEESRRAATERVR